MRFGLTLGWLAIVKKKIGHFLWHGSSKFHFFTDIWYPFCQRLLRPANVPFLKQIEEIQMSKLSKATTHHNSKKNWSFYPSEPFSFEHFTLIHPVYIPYARHYKPRLLYFLPHSYFRVVIITDNLWTKKENPLNFELKISGLHLRAVNN